MTILNRSMRLFLVGVLVSILLPATIHARRSSSSWGSRSRGSGSSWGSSSSGSSSWSNPSSSSSSSWSNPSSGISSSWSNPSSGISSSWSNPSSGISSSWSNPSSGISSSWSNPSSGIKYTSGEDPFRNLGISSGGTVDTSSLGSAYNNALKNMQRNNNNYLGVDTTWAGKPIKKKGKALKVDLLGLDKMNKKLGKKVLSLNMGSNPNLHTLVRNNMNNNGGHRLMNILHSTTTQRPESLPQTKKLSNEEEKTRQYYRDMDIFLKQWRHNMLSGKPKTHNIRMPTL